MDTISSLFEGMSEKYDSDTIDAFMEELPYELIHKLLGEIDKLGEMVISVREEVNALAADSVQAPYPDIAGDIWDTSYNDHPAMRRYREIYGDSDL